jgi:hypothetical protein
VYRLNCGHFWEGTGQWSTGAGKSHNNVRLRNNEIQWLVCVSAVSRQPFLLSLVTHGDNK